MPGPRTRLRVKLLKKNGALAGEAFTVEIGSRKIEGQTTGDGLLDVPIPPTARLAHVTLTGVHESFDVELGGLDPHDSETGIAQRLANLGYGGATGGNDGLVAAVSRFREAQGLGPGAMDAAFIDALEQAHGS
jgi:N-acetylmuramoyl-L-alanine amidase